MSETAHTAQPGAAYEKLAVFLGRWRARGESYAEGQSVNDPKASAVPWISHESYDWLPGGYFLLHCWDAKAGEKEFIGREIIGYDEAKGNYFTCLFDNSGNHPVYTAEVKDDVWTFSEPRTRATVTVHDGGDRMTFNWEWHNGGTEWLPLCDRVAERISMPA